jgi:predicted  nucleic acid-binding Zn-ribbon protein
MGDFRADFDQQIAALDTEITNAVNTNNEGKREFSRVVIERLTAINERIRVLANDITQLKNKLTGLQNQVIGNNGEIENGNRRLQELEAKNAELINQRDSAVAELEMLRQEYESRLQELQRRIDECEANLRDLSGQRDALTTERDALRNELQGKGDLQATHTGELQRLTGEQEQQLRIQQEECNKRLQEIESQLQTLRDEIATKDAEIARLNREAANMNTELERRIRELTSQNEENQKNIEGLQANVARLEGENAELIDRIRQATAAIRTAIARLREFNNPASFDTEARDLALNEIDQSIEVIRGLIQEQGAEQGAAVGTRPPPDSRHIQPEQRFTVIINNRNEKHTKPEILDLLRQKISKTLAPQQTVILEDIFQRLQKENNPRRFAAILQTENPLRQIGGKKSKTTTKKIRKNKKQKGGFTYNTNAKRKRFTSVFKTSSSPKTNSSVNLGRGKTKRNRH